jgi:hypothetical protein
MKINLILLLFCSLSYISKAQITATIKNPTDQKPIPYVNIWVENENIGVTADENGKFILTAPANSKLIFNALGYDDKTIEASKIDGLVYLIPKVFELKEVVVSSAKKTIENKIGTFKSNGISYSYATHNNHPYLAARYFPYNTKTIETPFIKTVMPYCHSNVNNVKFKLRLFEAKEGGLPGKELIAENIIVTVKKGTSKPIIDLSKYNLTFPENGLFVGLEFMQLESNKHLYTVYDVEAKKSIKQTSLEPSFALKNYLSKDGETWRFSRGNWSKANSQFINRKLLENEKKLLTVEITLTN